MMALSSLLYFLLGMSLASAVAFGVMLGVMRSLTDRISRLEYRLDDQTFPDQEW